MEQGALRGVWVLGAAGTGIKFAAFRGIPYAAPPVGPLRFKVSIRQWTGRRSPCTPRGGVGRPACPAHPTAGDVPAVYFK